MIATDSEWAQFVGAVLSTEEQENGVQPMYQRVQVRHPSSLIRERTGC
jgi:hypothetical protein